MRRLPAITLALALCAGSAYGGFFPENAFSDEARGLAGAQFLKTPPSARFAALAGAGLSLDGAEAFFLNPAGASGRAGALAVSYEALLENSSRTGLVFSRPSPASVFSAGLLYNNSSPGLEALDGAGGGYGHGITAYDAALGAGWARRFGRADFGLNLKYIKSRLAEASGTSAALDAGVVFREASPSRTELALAVRNFGPPLKLGAESAPLPFEFGAGLKYKYTRDMNFFAEGRVPSDHSPYLVFAGEWFLPYSETSGLALRSGLNFRNYDDHGAMGAFAGGFGFKFGGFTLDYAFSPYGDLGAAHRMTAGLAWGDVAPREPEPAPLPARAGMVVAPFSAGSGVTETEAAVVRNLVESELAKTGRFAVLERVNLDFILKENELDYAGLSEQAGAAELARRTGSELAVFGSVSKTPGGYRVTAGLADAASGAVLRSVKADAAEDYLFREAARRVAAALSR